MKYYWLIECDPKDWDVTNSLLNMEATHIATNSFGNYFVRRFIKKLTDEEATLLTLQYGHRLAIYPVTDNESIHLKDRGYMKS
jgi:predicted RNA-binding protein with PUA-like domain